MKPPVTIVVYHPLFISQIDMAIIYIVFDIEGNYVRCNLNKSVQKRSLICK